MFVARVRASRGRVWVSSVLHRGRVRASGCTHLRPISRGPAVHPGTAEPRRGARPSTCDSTTVTASCVSALTAPRICAVGMPRQWRVAAQLGRLGRSSQDERQALLEDGDDESRPRREDEDEDEGDARKERESDQDGSLRKTSRKAAGPQGGSKRRRVGSESDVSSYDAYL